MIFTRGVTDPHVMGEELLSLCAGWSRVNAIYRQHGPILSENVGDCAASDLMPQIGQSALDPRIAARSIFKRHAHHEINNGRHHARSTGPTSMTVIPLITSHVLPVPSHERVRRDDGLKFV